MTTIFLLTLIIFVICFIIGTAATYFLEDKTDKLFPCYDLLINIMTWSVFVMIGAGGAIIFLKVFSCIFN
jgi:hypothetical protein